MNQGGTAMAQEYVKIRATNPDGATANITEFCRSISWGGDWRNAARTLSYAQVVNQDDLRLPRAPTELGGERLMDAYALERTRDSLGNTIDVTAYDRGLYKIVMTLYTLAADQTGKEYRLRFRGPKLEVVELAVSEYTIRLKPGSNLLSCVTKESASSMTNSVAIYDEQCREVSRQEDSAAVALYGLMRQAIKAGSCDDPEGRAKKLLKENGLKTTITATALGNTKLVTGNTVALEEPVTGTSGLFWIQSDSHTWQRGVYRTKMTLSLERLMDRQEAGGCR